ncbi:hypothetical protein LY90DRAFT_705392 [Neocallimastix californiae]|uniref:BHLH domain-containing protein n=1 Tax=Neocallimastix californiae TaxID=1754190 RepID=A0A1Y2B7R6_9FUNG|nr:hypothetical protein LY90DRAFT_705392 [Neocallimastix californiae]|eukprot:ORY30873.1 hypothetical protein LY90DRAFT_705392 [Neocallimastix californiae]
MLYFDDMPLDWQLSILNNSQNGENDVEVSLLNQISNNSQNSKELLELKMSDNQLEQFLSTMDQPLINPYTNEQVHTTQNINTLTTTSISPLIHQQFIDSNSIRNPQLIINNTTMSIPPSKAETNIPANFTSNEQNKNVDNPQLIQELINRKLQTAQGHINNNIHDVNYSSLIYNQELLNNIPNNVSNLNIVGTKRKETMPDLSSVDNGSSKKIKMVTATVPSNTQNFTVPSTGITSSTTINTATVHPSALNNNAMMNLSLNDFSNNLQPTTTASISQDQILLQYLNNIKDKEHSTYPTVDTNHIPNIINALIASSNQNMNSMLNTPDSLNSQSIPSTSSSAVNIQNTFVPNLATSIKTESENGIHTSVTTNQYVSPKLINPMDTLPNKDLNTMEKHQQFKQHLTQRLPMNSSILTDNSAVKSATLIDDEKSGMDTTLIKDSSKNEKLLSPNGIQDSSSSTSSSAKHLSSNSTNTKYPSLNTDAPASSVSSNPNFGSVSWVKTQENSEMKMAISRLKTNEMNPPTVPVQVIKHQKKVAHNAIERRYRNNINDRIKQLQDVIPALQYTKSIKEKEKSQKEKGGGDEDVVKIDESLIIDGIPAARKLNKATVLKSATDYIVHLKKTSTNLKEENKRLLEFIKKVGGEEMLKQFTNENGDLYEEKETSTTTTTTTTTSTKGVRSSQKKSTSSKSKEKGKGKDKDKSQSLPVQEASPPHIYSSDSSSPDQINSPPSSSSTSNEDEGTMLDVLSGERENSGNNINDFNSNSTFTTLMVSLLLFSVGLFEYGSYLSNFDAISQYESYDVGHQGKILVARSEDPIIKPFAQQSFYQYIKSKLIKMEENLLVCIAFYLFIITIFIMVGKRIINYNKESRNKCVSSIASYSIIEKIIIINRIIVELIAFIMSKVSLRLFNKVFYLKNYSYTKLILSHCRMIEKDILITKNQSQQSLIAVFYTTLQIMNNINFVINDISYSTCAYILYTTAIQFFMNFRNVPFGKTIALGIWRRGNYYVSKINEDKEDYENTLRRRKKFDDYKGKRKININNEAIDFILTYINENPETSENSSPRCLLIIFSTAYKYDVLLNTFKEHGLKYIYMAPSVFSESGESIENETDSELENNHNIGSHTKDRKQMMEDFKNNYLSLSRNYFNNNYLITSLEVPISKIVSRLISDKKTKKEEKELSKMMKIDNILNTIVKVANSSILVNDINLYWYTQILWIMVSWKKEYFKPIISESTMDKINVQLFYADQFRKLIISTVTSYYSDVIQEKEDDIYSEEGELRPTYSEDLYSYSTLEEEEGDDDDENDDNEKTTNSESEYVSEFVTETIPDSTLTTSQSTELESRSESQSKSETRINRKLGQAYQNIANHYSLPNYSTVHFISNSTRQFITLSLFTWLMVQKKKFNIAKRSIEKAYQILDKITNISLQNDELSFTSLFEEENEYYPDVVLKFERIVIILAGTWLVEAEKEIINEEQIQSLQTKKINKDQKDNSVPILSLELDSTESQQTSIEKTPSLILSEQSIKKKEDDNEFNSENEISLADDVISLPEVGIKSDVTSNKAFIKSMANNNDSVIPKISGYVSTYLERYIKLLHYYQEMLPFIGSDKIAMECFKTIQHYQNEIKGYCIEF